MEDDEGSSSPFTPRDDNKDNSSPYTLSEIGSCFLSCIGFMFVAVQASVSTALLLSAVLMGGAYFYDKQTGSKFLLMLASGVAIALTTMVIDGCLLGYAEVLCVF